MSRSRAVAFTERGSIPGLLRRLASVSASGLIAFGALGTIVPNARAVDNEIATDVDVIDRPTSGPVDPIPYVFPDDGGSRGDGGSSDPSITIRPEFVATDAPSTKTAVEGAWTRDKRLWANPDGSYTMESGQRLNYLDTEGNWTPIDLTLVADEAGSWKPAAAPSDVLIKPDELDGTLATLTGDLGTISLQLPTAAAGTKVDDRLKFASLIPGEPEVFVRPTDEGVEFGATLADASVSRSVTVILNAGPYVPELDKDGRTIILHGTSKDDVTEVGRISAPSVYDETTAEAAPEDVSVTLTEIADETYALTYDISEKWLAASERVFPVTLDPTVCIQAGNASCQVSTNVRDIWYGSGLPSDYVTSSSTVALHVGRYQTGGVNDWVQTRSVLYFPGASLPDGAMVTDASMSLREYHNYSGATTARIYARLVDKPTGWTIDTSSASWNSLASAVDGAYDSPQYAPCSSGATDCTIAFDVTNMVRAWYTRRGQDWQPNAGVQVRYATEGTSSAYYETLFYRYNNSTVSNRPKLTITYEVPAFELDFDAGLGTTYAPSAMVLDQPTVLPIVIKNDSSFTFDSSYKIGYRFLDVKGAVKQSGTANLASTIASVPAPRPASRSPRRASPSASTRSGSTSPRSSARTRCMPRIGPRAVSSTPATSGS